MRRVLWKTASLEIEEAHGALSGTTSFTNFQISDNPQELLQDEKVRIILTFVI